MPGLAAPFVLRSAADALAIRAYAQRERCREALVVGAGPLGLETAYALHQYGLRVVVADPAPRLLHRFLDDGASERLTRYFRSIPIEIVLGARATHADSGTVVFDSGRTVRADIVVVCAGVAPNLSLAANAGLAVGKGVLVDDRMRTSDPSVYAAGDVAEFAGAPSGLWPTAVAQGRVAGVNAAGGQAHYRPTPVRMILKGVGIAVQSAGTTSPGPGDDLEVTEGRADEVQYRAVLRRDGAVRGAVFVGDWPDTEAILDAVDHQEPVLAG
jgi:NAD(P)H-nitrite reductase large subunit